jgi:hypothetical protein
MALVQRKRRSNWKASFTLNKIRQDAPALRARLSELPPYFSARRLAKFLVFTDWRLRRTPISKTPVLEWIQRGNLRLTQRGRRWLIARSEVEVLINAALRVRPYRTPLRPQFLILQRQLPRLAEYSQDRYSVRELAKHLGCCPATIRRAQKAGWLEWYRDGGRWKYRRSTFYTSEENSC